MKTVIQKDSADWLFDGWIVFAAIVFFTGGSFLIQGSLKEWVSLKPWTHRVGIILIVSTAFMWFYAKQRYLGAKLTHHSFLVSLHAKLKLSDSSWLLILFFAASTIWTTASWMRHEAFNSGFDMAIFTQAVWNTAHGSLFYSSIKGGINLLADHFSPILALPALPYKFLPDPKLLLLLQALSASVCVFPVYWIANKKMPKTKWPLAFVFAFVLYLPVRNAVRFDFHPEILVMPILFLAYYFLETDKPKWATLLMLIALLGRENVALVTLGMGFYSFIFKRHRRMLGFVWMLISLTYFVGVVYFVVPSLLKQDYFYLKGNYLAWMDLGLLAFCRHVFRIETISYLIKIFFPLGFLSFLNLPALVLTLPILFQNIFARNEMALSIFHQYTLLLTPFVFISAIEGTAQFRDRVKPIYLIAAAVLMAGVSDVYITQKYVEQIPPQKPIIDELSKEIPEDASLRTHEHLAPHFANRKHLHIYENNNPVEGGSQEALNSDYVLLFQNFLGHDGLNRVDRLRSGGYGVIYEKQGIYLLKRQQT